MSEKDAIAKARTAAVYLIEVTAILSARIPVPLKRISFTKTRIVR
jgi:hypothetical protein